MLKDFIDAKLKEIATLFAVKNKQYGDFDELANFRTGALMSYGRAGYTEMFEEAKAYQRKHIAFLQAHSIEQEKMDESLMDIALYSLIMLYMIEGYKEEACPNVYDKDNKECRSCSCAEDCINEMFQEEEKKNE